MDADRPVMVLIAAVALLASFAFFAGLVKSEAPTAGDVSEEDKRLRVEGTPTMAVTLGGANGRLRARTGSYAPDLATLLEAGDFLSGR